MIGKLKGIIDSYGEDAVILDVNGVGYLVHCSARTLQELPRAGEAATLSIETHVREDQIRLFGFTTDLEREWFKLLQTVQGVGTKVALAVLGTLKPADLASAIALRDKAMVARTPGVGPKVAERIVTELKDKAPAYTQIDPAWVRLSGALDEKRAPQPRTDAVSALVNLGYGQPQAAAAIAAAARAAGAGADARSLIRLGLKGIDKRVPARRGRADRAVDRHYTGVRRARALDRGAHLGRTGGRHRGAAGFRWGRPRPPLAHPARAHLRGADELLFRDRPGRRRRPGDRIDPGFRRPCRLAV